MKDAFTVEYSLREFEVFDDVIDGYRMGKVVPLMMLLTKGPIELGLIEKIYSLN